MSRVNADSGLGDGQVVPDTHQEGGLVETRSIDYIPRSERHGKAWHLWPIWFCGDAHLTTLAVGVIGVGLGGNLFWSAVAIVLGCLFGGLFMAGHSAQGPQMGMPQLIQSRPQFGYLGALLIYVVAIMVYVGYNAFNQLLSGQTLNELTGMNARVGAFAFTALAMLMAFFGYMSFHKLQRWLSFIIIAALLIFTVGIAFTGDFPIAQLDPTNFSMTPFIAQIGVAAAYQLSWAIYVSDYSRYLPHNINPRASFWWTYTGATIGGSWMMLVGATAAGLVASGSDTNVAQALANAGDSVIPGFGVPLVILTLIGLITSAAQNFYGASLTLLSIADTIRPIRPTLAKRVVSLLVTGGIAMAIAYSASGDFLTEFGSFLAVMLYFLTPWTAINLIDFYVLRHGHYSIREIFKRHGMYGLWNWRGLTAYAIGFVAMIPFFATAWYTGPIADLLGGADLAMIPGLLVSGLVFWLLSRNVDIPAELLQVRAADAGLDEDTPAESA